MNIDNFDLLESYIQSIDDYVIELAKFHWDNGFFDDYEGFADDINEDGYGRDIDDNKMSELYTLYTDTYDECRANAVDDEFYYDTDKEDF